MKAGNVLKIGLGCAMALMIAGCGGGGNGQEELVEVSGKTMLPLCTPEYGTELWKSDGTSEGTELVKDIWVGGDGNSSDPDYLTGLGGSVYFAATTPVSESGSSAGKGTKKPIIKRTRLLWKSDGSESGTTKVSDRAGNPQYITEWNGQLFFRAYDSTHGSELWKSDGTDVGTQMLKDIRPGNDGSSPKHFTPYNGKLYFVANKSELWRTNGTEQGTLAVRDGNGNQVSGIFQPPVVSGDFLYFITIDQESGEKLLWEVGNNETATLLIGPSNLGNENIYRSGLVDYNGIPYYIRNISDQDGNDDYSLCHYTESMGESCILDLSSEIESLIVSKEKLFFTNSSKLYVSNGTQDGTYVLTNVNDADDLMNVNGKLFFTAHDDEHGRELWISDGTEEGTKMLKDINPGSRGSDIFRSLMRRVGDELWFIAYDGNETALWKSDGTPEGTVKIKGGLCREH